MCIRDRLTAVPINYIRSENSFSILLTNSLDTKRYSSINWAHFFAFISPRACIENAFWTASVAISIRSLWSYLKYLSQYFTDFHSLEVILYVGTPWTIRTRFFATSCL
eukprot:TRINITY_DN9467_c0_g2_i3.p1 TRINITY_DN9467_c0_g2~~TRINITY_DN9467_c0_g2_i3.p1  ORF type:complete len:108 (+),score=0.06 TRINITY_DN9467_c0_g2_i3:65-388(+)